MQCPRCDHRLDASDRFCGRCGLARTTDGVPVDPLIGLKIAGRYRIERRIGVGGMGTVYLGIHDRLGLKVAVKVLHERYADDPMLTQRFEREALTYGRLAHPNLVTLHDYGRAEGGTFYMVLEYCPGISLAQLLRTKERLEPALAADLVAQIAQGLSAAHAAGIVHRDLKPENVILMETRPGRYHLKLLDFGIAKNVEEEEGPRLTQAGMVFGTPEYMAPEQARGEEVDARSDLYALGAVLYELLSGQPPFTGRNKMQVMHRQATEAPEPLSARLGPGVVPAALEAVVTRCLAKRPDERFVRCEDLIVALENALGADRLTPAPQPPVPPESLAEGTPTTGGSGAVTEAVARAAARTDPGSHLDSGVEAAPAADAAAASPPATHSSSGGWALSASAAESGHSDGWSLPEGTDSTPPGAAPAPESFSDDLAPPQVGRLAWLSAAALFVVVVGGAAWLFSVRPPEDTRVGAAGTVVRVAVPETRPAPLPNPPPSETPGEAVAAPAPGPAKAGAVTPAPDPARDVRPAVEPAKRVEAPAKEAPVARPPVSDEGRAVANGGGDDARRADSKSSGSAAPSPSPPPSNAAAEARARKRAEQARTARLNQARKALRAGKFDDASKAADALLEQDAADRDALALRREVNELRQALALGRLAYEGHDCDNALVALQPVLDAAPGAPGVSQMVKSCRTGLPPKRL